MSKKSKIEWTETTWNPLRGCSRVSEGCRNCYAESMAARFCGAGQPYEGTINPETKRWNGKVRLVPEKLDEPLRWQRPRMVFVNSMSDLFHEDVPDDYINKVFAVMALAPQHTFQVLTKRPERMLEYMRTGDGEGGSRWGAIIGMLRDAPESWPELERSAQWPLPNVWLGVTVENQESADKRIPLLLQTPAAVRWVSMEPLLGSVNLRKIPSVIFDGSMDSLAGRFKWNSGEVTKETSSLDWVVVGGESGHNARPMHPDWALSLRDQCAAARVPFLFKQWGEFYPTTYRYDDAGITSSWDATDPVLRAAKWGEPHEFSGGVGAVRIGKKSSGRLLDGVQHDGYPV